jgi:peptide/nickel transport system substrate-binding protein
MKKFFMIPFVFILLFGLILSGCASTATTTPAQSPASVKTPISSTSAPQYGGTLKVVQLPGLTNLGLPGKASVVADFFTARPSIESLLNFDEKGTGLPVPWLATGWQISPDYKSVTLTLKKGVKFQDGTDFNAEAAKYCLDLTRLGVRPELKPISSIDIMDDYTIRLNLSTYDPSMIGTLAGNVGMMVSPTALKSMGDGAMTHPVGTGPYKFASYQRDVSLKFDRFDGYWGGKPYLDGIEYNFIAEPVTSLASFKAGEAQVIGSVGPKDSSDLKATGKYNVIALPANIACLIGDSAHSDSPFSKIGVRQAIAYAINKEELAKTLGFGFYPLTNQFAPPGAWYNNPSVAGYAYNPQKAKDLLNQAGYSNGLQTKITFSTSPTAMDLYTAIQSYLQAVGINATLDPADAARNLKTQTGGWNNQLIGYTMPCSPGMDPGQALLGNFSSKATRIDPKTFYNPPDYDSAFFLATAEPDAQKRQAMFQELMKTIIDKYCMAVPLFVNTSFTISDLKVHDLDMAKYNATQWRPEKVWLSK